MNGLLGNLFGVQEEDPLLALLPPEQRARLLAQTRSQGIANLGLALLSRGVSDVPVSFAQTLGQAGMQAQQANQGLMDANLQRLLAARKLAEEQRQLAEREKFKAAIPNLFGTQTVQPEAVDVEGRPGAGVVPQPVTQTTFNQQKAMELAMQYPQLAKDYFGGLQEVRKFMKPETVSVQAGERVYNPLTGELMFEGGEKPESKPEIQRLLEQRQNYNPDSETYKALSARINKLTEVTPPASTNVVVNTGQTFFKELANQFGTDFAQRIAGGQVAQRNLQTLGQIRSAIPKAITGTGANIRLEAARLAETLGVGGKDNTERLAQTSTLIQGLAQNELQAAEQMKGQGQITEAERLIIRRAASGDINFTGPELNALVNALEKVANYRLQSAKGAVSTLRSNPAAKELVPFLPDFGGGMPTGARVTRLPGG